MIATRTGIPSVKPTAGLYRRIASLMAILMLLCLSGIAGAVPPPAGTSIGNQASATYTDASGIGRQVTSNPVQTIVLQVASLTLVSTQTQTATPGSVVYYPHTVTNTGNGSDTFNLGAVNTSGPFNMSNIQIFADNGSGQPVGPAITNSGSLASGASFRFIVVATVPVTATTGQQNVMTVTATSQFDGTKTATNTDTTKVTSNAVIALTKGISASSGAPGSGPYTYTLTYTNNGNNTATTVTVTDIVPSGMAYIAASSRWSITGATALSDSGGTTGTAPNTITSSYNAGSGTLTYVVNQVTPGQSGTITFQVNVKAGTLAGVQNNTATESYNDGSGTTVSGNSNTVPFNVTATTTAGVTMTGSTVASANPGTLVSFTNVVTNTGNATDTFDITFVSNTFPVGTTFTLFKSDGVTPLVDTNGNGIPDTGPLAPGASYNVIVKAQLPANASGGPFNLIKKATSTINPTVSTTTTDTLTSVTADSVDLTNNSAVTTPPAPPAPGQGAGPEPTPVITNTVNPGASSTFTIYVNNTGPVSDSYNLAASNVANFSSITLPPGWTVVFKLDGGAGNCSTTGATISTTPSVPAGGNVVVCAVVTVPATGAGSVAGTSDTYFRAVSSASGAHDTIHDAVTVNQIRAITIAPNNTNQTYPGGTVVYTQHLTNNGNSVEGNGTASTITLSAADIKAGWTSVLYYDANNNGVLDATDPIVPAAGIQALPGLSGGLAPGQSITIFDKVTAPSGAQVGDVDVSTITVTTANGTYTSPAPPVATATNGTTIIAGNLQLVKMQALDATCSGPTGGTVYSMANVNALPGQCVLYQITVTNVGTAAATSVVVSDATPAYTTLSSAATTTVGTVTSPGIGSTGTVSATVGALNPAQNAVVVFGVKVQQ
ncbi:MAG: DUF11 domain-containing protein [Proteobacteria bacterium]|nr:DUF11 domain-containing protein [Pseudomonadota bacterium]